MFKHGLLERGSEFRGSRSPEAMMKFVVDQARTSVLPVSVDSARDVKSSQVVILGKFSNNDWKNLETLKKSSSHFLDSRCGFYAKLSENPVTPPSVTAFDNEDQLEDSFPDPLSDYYKFLAWLKAKCVPLARELTFENAEALSEEGLPFVILFRANDDANSLDKFKSLITLELHDYVDRVNFMHADGIVFKHPLSHLNRNADDLPLIAIDNFVHMFDMRKGQSDWTKPGDLKQFLVDFVSGRLHEEYHSMDNAWKRGMRESSSSSDGLLKSVFRKLVPNGRRYSILNRDRDEL
jgi:endoplasmic reticulum resident protein 44